MNKLFVILFNLILIIFNVTSCTDEALITYEEQIDSELITQMPEIIYSDEELISRYKFKKFYIFDDTHIIYRDYKEVENFINPNNLTLRVEVVGYVPGLMVNDLINNIIQSVYIIKITDTYSEISVDINTEYIIYYIGNPERQVYRIPELEINKEYLLLNTYPSDLVNGTSICMWMDIKEFDGIEYVYPFAFECSSLENNISIKNNEEAAIYNENKNADVIEYMIENDIEHPQFKYKFELNDFLQQINKLRRS